MIYKGFEKFTHLRQPVIISSRCLITRYLSSSDPPLGMESGKITEGQLNSSSSMGSICAASNARLNLQFMSPLVVAIWAWYTPQQSEEYWLKVDLVTPHVISAVSHTYYVLKNYVCCTLTKRGLFRQSAFHFINANLS